MHVHDIRVHVYSWNDMNTLTTDMPDTPSIVCKGNSITHVTACMFMILEYMYMHAGNITNVLTHLCRLAVIILRSSEIPVHYNYTIIMVKRYIGFACKQEHF